MMAESQQIKKVSPPRIAGLDFIRVFASLFTIAGHFFVLNTPFKSTIFDGSFSLFIQSMANFIFKGTPLVSGEKFSDNVLIIKHQ